MEAIAIIRLEAIALSLEAMVLRLEAIASTLEAIPLRLEAIALRLEAIPSRLEPSLLGWRPSLLFTLWLHKVTLPNPSD